MPRNRDFPRGRHTAAVEGLHREKPRRLPKRKPTWEAATQGRLAQLLQELLDRGVDGNGLFKRREMPRRRNQNKRSARNGARRLTHSRSRRDLVFAAV